jgi:hypothetical protein
MRLLLLPVADLFVLRLGGPTPGLSSIAAAATLHCLRNSDPPDAGQLDSGRQPARYPIHFEQV